MSTNGLYLVFCLSGQREVSGKSLPHQEKQWLAGLWTKAAGAGRQDVELRKDRGPETQSCCYGSPGRRAGCWGFPGYSWDTYTGTKHSSSFSVVIHCLKTPPGSCSSLTLGGP